MELESRMDWRINDGKCLEHLMNQITPAGAVMQLGAKNTGLGNKVFDFPELMDSPSAGITDVAQKSGI